MNEMQDKIKRLRRVLGLSREVFSRRLRVSLQTVYRWESGKAEPTGLYAEKIDRMVKKYLGESSVQKN